VKQNSNVSLHPLNFQNGLNANKKKKPSFKGSRILVGIL
jgi:hypothetical protein